MFHDGLCVELISSLMGIILVSILVHDYLPSKATIIETKHIIPSLLLHT